MSEAMSDLVIKGIFVAWIIGVGILTVKMIQAKRPGPPDG